MTSRITLLLQALLLFGMQASGVNCFVFGARHRSRVPPLRMTANGDTLPVVDFGNVGFVLLAGGTGSRMKATMPKQFLPLQGVPVLHHSLNLFLERLPAFAAQQGLR